MTTSITVRPQGQRLILTVTPLRTGVVAYTDAACTTPISVPRVITSSTATYFVEAIAGKTMPVRVQVDQADGTSLYDRTHRIGPNSQLVITPEPGVIDLAIDTEAISDTADDAYQKPAAGIPAADLAADLQAAVTALAAVRATVVELTVDDATITTAETSTFAVEVAPAHVTGAVTGSVRLYVGATAVSDVTALVSGAASIPVPGSVLAVGEKAVTAVFTPAAGSPWTTSTSDAVTVTVTGV